MGVQLFLPSEHSRHLARSRQRLDRAMSLAGGRLLEKRIGPKLRCGAVVPTLDDPVTPARGCLETFLIEDADIAAAVADQFASLQVAGSLGNSNPQHAQHVA